MTERRRIIEGTWTCKECGTADILGRHKQCPQCGAAREQAETAFHFGATTATGASTAATVTDAAAVELAKAGADWHCKYCSAGNRGDGTHCATCGAEREEESKRTAPTPPAPTPSGLPRWLKVLGAVALLIAVVVWWGSRTHEQHGTVSARAWSHTLVHERFTRVDLTGWRSDLRESPAVMPVAGSGEQPGVLDVRGCNRQQREPERCRTEHKQVTCGTEQQCTVKDQGNGFAEEVCQDVTKYCDEPYEVCTPAVYDEQCTYTTHEWRELNRTTATGTEQAPTWPAPPGMPEAHDRIRRLGEYTVTVSYGAEAPFEHKPATEDEFNHWTIGAQAEVTVSNFGAAREARLIAP